MDDLIRRGDAIKVLRESIAKMPSTYSYGIFASMDVIDSIPAVVRRERHGRWFPHPNKEYPDTEVCSSCGMGTITGKFIFQFCPWCGARMDGRREDGDT